VRLLFVIVLLNSIPFAYAELTTTVMAPLTIGNWQNPDDPEREHEWQTYAEELKRLKELGVDAISTDVWWGIIEPERGQFNWRYYHKLFQVIRDAGLKWVPILAFHKLGGNVGDDADIPLPNHVWSLWREYPQVFQSERDLMSRSELGNYNGEIIAPTATEYALDLYKTVMREFQREFVYAAEHIFEINISLGPAGELRKPSYNPHDPDAQYPGRGRFQIYGRLWRRGFIQYIQQRYKSLTGLNERWGTGLGSFSEVAPPEDMEAFLQRRDHFGAYGMDVIDYQNEVLLRHQELLIGSAFDEFDHAQAPFQDIDIGAKIPGIHWRMGHDRLAELASGLVRTSYGEDKWNTAESGYGYLATLEGFKKIAERARSSRFVLHFTALEMDNGDGGPHVGSEAKSLVFYMADAAQRLGLTIKGENALSFKLNEERAWWNIKDAIEHGPYFGLTYLRHNTIMSSESALRGLSDFMDWRSRRCDLLLRQPPELQGLRSPHQTAH
jgi:beta-amylase